MESAAELQAQRALTHRRAGAVRVARTEPAVRLKALSVPNRADRPGYRTAPVEGHINGAPRAVARTSGRTRSRRHARRQGHRGANPLDRKQALARLPRKRADRRADGREPTRPGTGRYMRQTDRSGPSPRGNSGTHSRRRRARQWSSAGDLRPSRPRCCRLPEGRRQAPPSPLVPSRETASQPALRRAATDRSRADALRVPPHLAVHHRDVPRAWGSQRRARARRRVQRRRAPVDTRGISSSSTRPLRSRAL